MTGIGPEDAKLVTLARSARARLAREEAAAVRDTSGRTYVAASVTLPHLQLSAVQAAVAAAVASGALGLEAVVVVTEQTRPAPMDLEVAGDLAGSGAVLHLVGPDAQVQVSVALGDRA